MKLEQAKQGLNYLKKIIEGNGADLKSIVNRKIVAVESCIFMVDTECLSETEEIKYDMLREDKKMLLELKHHLYGLEF